MKLLAKSDGSGNSPKGSAAGAVVFDEDGQILLERSEVWEPGTNNVAEYRGVLLAIQMGIDLEADDFYIFSDSKLVVNQINESYRVKDDALLLLRDSVWDLASSFESVSVSWIPREENTLADRLCRVAIKDSLSSSRKRS